MFRDARTLDVERTAAAFDTAWKRYAAHTEDWFDGSVGSIDTRLAACNQLLHRVGATVARMNLTDAHRYLTAAEDLSADQAALQDLRYAMLTGAAGREDVPHEFHEPPGGLPAGNLDLEPAWHNKAQAIEDFENKYGPLSMEDLADIGEYEHRDYLRSRGRNRLGPIEGSHTACNDFNSDHHPKVPKTKLDKKQKLSGTDRRWVTLEAARFVAANASTCDDPHELATRAQHHAAVKTSTFTPARSQEICAAFVDEVRGLSSAAPRPMTVRTAALDTDWDAQYMYLC